MNKDIAITDQNGETVARYAYDAWGACVITQDTSGCGIATINPYRYRGYYFDRETGLYYVISRYYDPKVGRFLNGDEMLYALLNRSSLSANVFAYCYNNPVTNSDLNGYYTICSLQKESWLFELASNFGINLSCISHDLHAKIYKIDLWLIRLVLRVSVGLTANNKAGISANFTENDIGVSANIGMGSGYSLAFACSVSWWSTKRSISLVYSATNDGVFASLDLEFEVSHIASLAAIAASIYWPGFVPVIYELLSPSKTAAVGAMTMLVPIIKGTYM